MDRLDSVEQLDEILSDVNVLTIGGSTVEDILFNEFVQSVELAQVCLEENVLVLQIFVPIVVIKQRNELIIFDIGNVQRLVK